ncbi:metallophosphoesterase [Labilibaculum sp.]|uniref:metallophosphoesterase n=1 Tax=Labilibaculum sp. TaxID=2060723 RepID=UPI0035696F08
MQIKKFYIHTILLILLACTESQAAFRQDSTHVDSLLVSSYVEGPHLKYISGSKVEAFYVVHDSSKNITKKISKTFRFKRDTIKFVGFAGNDSLQYVIPHKIKPEHGENVSNDKIIILGDIHGEYEALLSILRFNKVIDENNQWIYGNGQLVFTGDVFDRGNQVTECLWFIFRLEIQAKKQGGKVHYLLGNHEMMALLFDDRYVTDKYQHAAHHVQYHYSHFFDKKSVLGKWLRSKNTLVRIGRQLFVHGGISPEFLEQKLKIDKVNSEMRYYIDNYTELKDTTMVDLFLYSYSPLWYRGYLSRTLKYDRISLQDVLKTLEFYQSDVIIFGHTPVPRVYPFYSFKLIGMDVPIGDPHFIDQGLLIENQKYYRIFAHKEKVRLQ